ncbi:hypothetical protein PACTADRAFT_50224 [Pachysolen tannophilus NRRL Y-2460]|uniref:Kinesin-like protein n=1 Tax=Pachysolen tannophilus NRRL Y-2460 TaxID=669874 RepID=A0A1E4TUW0_PACTA|nr:hypothetical protein PACTADRAFT_50224 [Pachysolen tannophilus NRRL Y-2460]
MVLSSNTAPSKLRAQTPTRITVKTSDSPPPSRPSSSLSRPRPIRPSSSVSNRTPVRASANNVKHSNSLSSSSSRASRYSSFNTPSRPMSSMSSFRPMTPLVSNSSLTGQQHNNNAQVYTGTIRVAIRPRPLVENNIPLSWNIDCENSIIANSELGEFQYDHVFDPMINNKDIFTNLVEPVISQFVDGFNGTIFAYGMTGSGKTYSMQGAEFEEGLIQLAVGNIYNCLEKRSRIKHDEISISYLEIYNEKLYDLLNSDTSNSLKSTMGFGSTSSSSSSINTTSIREDLKIRDDPLYGVKVIGLHEQQVSSPQELLTYISQGDSIRRTGGTDFNSRSSRSHAVVLIKLKSVDLSTGVEKFSTLSLCDLAGSERATRQQERRKEGAFINKSLLALSTVISKLSAQSSNNNNTFLVPQTPTGATHIPYRDSKLTRLLQSSLSGNSIVSILCTIHLSSTTLSETVNTLRFASRAKNISLNVKKNEGHINDKDKLISKLKLELDRYKKEVTLLKNEHGNNQLPSPINNSKIRKTSLESTVSNSSTNSQFSSKQSSSASSRETSISESSPLYSSSQKKLHILESSIIALNEELSQNKAENKILTEQVEHYKRLNDYSRLNSIMIKNELLQSLPDLENVSAEEKNEIIIGLEDFYKKQFLEIEELKSYISHLENKLGFFEKINSKNDNSTIEEISLLNKIVKDQEEEIMDLKEQLDDKNSIINALKASSKVRESLVSKNEEFRTGLSIREADESMRSDVSMRSCHDDHLDVVEDSKQVLKPIDSQRLNYSLNSNEDTKKKLEIEDSW